MIQILIILQLEDSLLNQSILINELKGKAKIQSNTEVKEMSIQVVH